MENKIDPSKLPHPKNIFGLLPNYFKKIGWLIIILTIVSLLILKALKIEFEIIQKEIIRMIFFNILIIGLLLIAWARDNTEDERSLLIRLRTMAIVFIQAVFYVIIRPFVDMIFSDPIESISSQELIFYMLFMYLIFLFLQKKGYVAFEKKKRK